MFTVSRGAWWYSSCTCCAEARPAPSTSAAATVIQIFIAPSSFPRVCGSAKGQAEAAHRPCRAARGRSGGGIHRERQQRNAVLLQQALDFRGLAGDELLETVFELALPPAGCHPHAVGEENSRHRVTLDGRELKVGADLLGIVAGDRAPDEGHVDGAVHHRADDIFGLVHAADVRGAEPYQISHHA